jgi:hypothetical protein
VCKASHLEGSNSSVCFNNAYTNAYIANFDFKAMSCCSVPSQPTHLRSSVALAPLSLPLDYGGKSDPRYLIL